jgi:HEAT repeat protein
MTTRRAIIIGSILALIGAAVYVRTHIETIGDRKRVYAEINALATQFKQDPNDTFALNTIISYLDANSSFTRTSAADALGNLGPSARAAIPGLVRTLNSGDLFAERAAAIAIGKIGIDMDQVVEPLRIKIRNPKSDAAIFAAESLGNIGKPALVAIPDREEAAHSSSEWMRKTATESIAKLKALENK